MYYIKKYSLHFKSINMMKLWIMGVILVLCAAQFVFNKKRKRVLVKYNDLITTAAICWIASTLKGEPLYGVEISGSINVLYVKLIDEKDTTISNPQLKKFLKLLKEYFVQEAMSETRTWIIVTYTVQGKLCDICKKTGVSVNAFRNNSEMILDFKNEMVLLRMEGNPEEVVYSRRKSH